MIGIAIALGSGIVSALILLALRFKAKAPEFKQLEEPHYPNFSDLARSLPEDHPIVQAINLPEEKFAPKEYTREQLLEQARMYSQEYATRHPQQPFVTADFINQLLVLNNLPVLGKYASGFFRNKKLFAKTSMQTPSNFPSAKRRIIKVYRYIGPVSTAIN